MPPQGHMPTRSAARLIIECQHPDCNAKYQQKIPLSQLREEICRGLKCRECGTFQIRVSMHNIFLRWLTKHPREK